MYSWCPERKVMAIGRIRLEIVDDILDARVQPASPDADEHGQEDPER
jgi:hypothetical protein